MKQPKYRNKTTRLCVLLVLLFSFSLAPLAEAKEIRCPTRKSNPTQEHNDPIGYKELKQYVLGTHKVFIGKAKETTRSVAGFRETNFEVLRRYRGTKRSEKEINIVHVKGKYENLKGPALIRARYGNDGNLYAYPMNCPEYYMDEEVVSFLNTWPRAILIFIILVLTFYMSASVLDRSRNKDQARR